MLLFYYYVILYSESSVWLWVWNRAVQGGIIWARVWALQEEGCSNSNTAVLVQSHSLLTVTLSGEHRGHHHSQLVLQGLTNTLIATDFHLKWLYFGDLREMFYHWPRDFSDTPRADQQSHTKLRKLARSRGLWGPKRRWSIIGASARSSWCWCPVFIIPWTWRQIRIFQQVRARYIGTARSAASLPLNATRRDWNARVKSCL